MKTAVIYARYSSDRQTEQSIEGQLSVCYQYAEERDIKIVNTYIDRAMTGTNDKRVAFQKMLKDSNKQAWDYVLVYKIDRFGRNKYEIAINKNTLRNNKVKLLSATENIPDTPEGIILESLLEGMAEYYSAELSQKVKRGMNESRKKGNFTGGTLPYGYKKDGKKVVIDEDQAKIVLYIYEQYAKNIYVKDIIVDLTSKGILNHGKPFAKTTLHRILTNEKYSGIFHYQDEVFDNTYPRIIPEKLFQIVQKKNKDNKYGSHSRYVTYLLRKKVVCGYCGNNINGQTGSSKTSGVKRYYGCAGNYQKKICKKKNVRKEALEDIVIKALIKTFESDSLINSFANKIIKMREEKAKNNPVMNLLLQEQADILSAKDNLLKAIEKGVITTSTKSRLMSLEKKESEIKDKIVLESARAKMVINKSDIVNYIKKALEQNYEQLIDLLVKKIVLFDDKIEIYCNYVEDDEVSQNYSVVLYDEKVDIPIPTQKSNVELATASVQIKIEP